MVENFAVYLVVKLAKYNKSGNAVTFSTCILLGVVRQAYKPQLGDSFELFNLHRTMKLISLLYLFYILFLGRIRLLKVRSLSISIRKYQ